MHPLNATGLDRTPERFSRRQPRGVLLALLPLSAATAGCPVTTSLPSAAPVQEYRLSEDGPKYYLYVPSTYRRDRAYPLVIACHGMEPFDSAYAQITEWAQFAETQHLIVAAPMLKSPRGFPRPSAKDELALLRADEAILLRLVSTLKASRNIAEEQVFLTGWSAGSFPILYAGLRNPDVFRALAIRQGTFDPAYLEVDAERLDRWQPIYLYYGSTDPLRDESMACIRWLREHDLFVEHLELPGTHRRVDVAVAWKYFRRIVRERPWIRLHAAKPNPADRRVVRFWCESKPETLRLRWDFGDGHTSQEREPTHAYAQPGRYEVACEVRLRGNHAYRRRTFVHVAAPSGGP